MRNWAYLFAAIVAETIATSALRACDGFTRAVPSLLVVVGYGASFWLLAKTLKAIPVGIAYAVWSGVGTVLITTAGVLLFGQKLDAAAWLGIGLIVAGVIVLNGFSAAAGH